METDSEPEKIFTDELGVQNRGDLLPTHTTTGDQLISKMKKRQRLQWFFFGAQKIRCVFQKKTRQDHTISSQGETDTLPGVLTF